MEASMTVDDMKRRAGDRAAAMVTSGTVVGLGSGSTARYATLRIAERLRTGELHDVLGIPTSEDTAVLAAEGGIPLTTLEEHGAIDMTIDGADEVDPHWNVIKGLGGALLREKIVAYATRVEVMVVDESKLVSRLGQKSPVPVEVLQFGWRNTRRGLEKTGARPVLRMHGEHPFVTDEGNWILDCYYAPIAKPAILAQLIKEIPGVVEHGLFLGMVHGVVVAGPEGVRVLEKR
jgi:ribose 5-phosphate isomerase A